MALLRLRTTSRKSLSTPQNTLPAIIQKIFPPNFKPEIFQNIPKHSKTFQIVPNLPKSPNKTTPKSKNAIYFRSEPLFLSQPYNLPAKGRKAATGLKKWQIRYFLPPIHRAGSFLFLLSAILEPATPLSRHATVNSPPGSESRDTRSEKCFSPPARVYAYAHTSHRQRAAEAGRRGAEGWRGERPGRGATPL